MTAFFRHVIRLAAICAFATAASAQDNAAQIDAIIKSAESGGSQVIIINPNGPGAEEDGPGVHDRLQKSFMLTTQERLAAFRTTLRERLNAAPASVAEVLFILNGQSPTGHWGEYLRILGWTIVFLVGAEMIVRETCEKRMVGPSIRRLQKENPIGYSDKLPILLLRVLAAVGGLVLATGFGYAFGYMVFGESADGTARLTVAYIYLSYIMARGMAFLWRMILSPDVAGYRIPRITDSDARKFCRWLVTVTTIAVFVISFCKWLEELGISYNVHALFNAALTLFVVILNTLMVFANRRTITSALLNGQKPGQLPVTTRFVARAWLPAVLIYFYVAWVEMSYRLIEELPLGWPLIAGFLIIVFTVLGVYGSVGYVIEHVFRRNRFVHEMQMRLASERAEVADENTGPGAREITVDPAPEPHKMRTFEDLSRRIAGILAVGSGVYVALWIWRVDLGVMAGGETWFLSNAHDVAAILFIGYFTYHAVRIWIDQKIKEEGGDQVEVVPGDEGGAGGASRLATLLPLFRNFMLFVIFVSFALIMLTNIGINVSALFAGAGIVGLAIGFGAQTLVRDIFSGAFFLFDDAFRKGEYIDVGSVKGTVEKISVRSFQLRHHLGPLHTIPFGEIQHLTNFSRDWVMMKLPLRVTYDTDVEHVRKLIKKLGQKLAEDALVGHQFLQPLKSQGVIEMQDSAMIIRVKFMTKPGDQWVLRKRVYQEIRDLFAREGIKFAHREVTVRIAGDGDNLTDKQKEAVGAAALSSVDEDDFAEAMANSSGDDR
ncbi:MAG: mechanosensitive ion channel [Rhodobacteraceae bacterium]|nr:mechanosensitive ion channel [Paracoccaceae bacterium]